MRTPLNEKTLYTREELEEMVAKMRQANATFYRLAQGTGCHAFIEFCGLQAKFIDICQETLEAGEDFNLANIHAGYPIAIAGHHKRYFFEKLNCIMGASIPEVNELYERLHGGAR